jgi:hypothetical protein
MNLWRLKGMKRIWAMGMCMLQLVPVRAMTLIRTMDANSMGRSPCLTVRGMAHVLVNSLMGSFTETGLPNFSTRELHPSGSVEQPSPV